MRDKIIPTLVLIALSALVTAGVLLFGLMGVFPYRF
jgi:hypothetical protein